MKIEFDNNYLQYYIDSELSPIYIREYGTCRNSYEQITYELMDNVFKSLTKKLEKELLDNSNKK